MHRTPHTRVHRDTRMKAFRSVWFWMPVLVLFGGIANALAIPDLSGEWEIHEEERSYTTTLDRNGDGPYTWQDGRIQTTAFSDRRWQGTWSQPGNDRDGGFEVLLSEDGTSAEGRWWYTRVGQTVIPPREWGGEFKWMRRTQPPAAIPGP